MRTSLIGYNVKPHCPEEEFDVGAEAGFMSK
jgi:hypothetical protein